MKNDKTLKHETFPIKYTGNTLYKNTIVTNERLTCTRDVVWGPYIILSTVRYRTVLFRNPLFQ